MGFCVDIAALCHVNTFGICPGPRLFELGNSLSNISATTESGLCRPREDDEAHDHSGYVTRGF